MGRASPLTSLQLQIGACVTPTNVRFLFSYPSFSFRPFADLHTPHSSDRTLSFLEKALARLAGEEACRLACASGPASMAEVEMTKAQRARNPVMLLKVQPEGGSSRGLGKQHCVLGGVQGV